MRTSPSGPLRSAVLAALLSLLGAPFAVAQEGRSALRVVVTDASTGEPVRDARLVLLGTRVGGAADDQGRLVLRNLVPGTAVLEVSRLGYTAARVPVSLDAGATHDLAVALRADPLELDALRADGRTGPARDHAAWARGMLESRGFFERRESGSGVFMVREEITRTHSRSMTQLLSRHRRLNLSGEAWSSAPAARRGGNRPQATASGGCRPAFYLDGVLVEAFDVNSVRPDDVEALEIYRGASELPPAFNRGTSGCGAVVIWTRVN